MTQPSLTIVSVTGHDSYAIGAEWAIKRSYLELRDHITQLDCLLISPTRPDNLPPYAKHIACIQKTYFPTAHSIESEFSLVRLLHAGYRVFIPKECNYTQQDIWL